MIIKTAWHWQIHRHTIQWNKIKIPEINPHVYGPIIFDKDAKEKTMEKERFFNK